MLRLLDPRFLFRSGNSQSCRNRVQVPHLGFTLSHFNFRFRHDTQDMVLSDRGGALLFPFPVVGGQFSGESFSPSTSTSPDDEVELCRSAWLGSHPSANPDIVGDSVMTCTSGKKRERFDVLCVFPLKFPNPKEVT